jgi:hypothetical protein
MQIVFFIVFFIVLLLWSVIGLLFWIPLLARMIVITTVVVIASVFGDADLAGARTGLNAAVGFYAYGFRRVFELLEDKECGKIKKPHPAEIDLFRICLETIYLLIFWGVIALPFVVPFNVRSNIASQLPTKTPAYDGVVVIQFNDNVSTEFDVVRNSLTSSHSTTLKVVFHQISINKELKFAEIKFSMCNIGASGWYYTPLYLWYSDADGRESVVWVLKHDDEANIDGYVRSNECETHILKNRHEVGDKNDTDSIRKPFGTIHVSFDHSESLANVNLGEMDNQGLVTRHFDTKE